jgi:hypothetical protein
MGDSRKIVEPWVEDGEIGMDNVVTDISNLNEMLEIIIQRREVDGSLTVHSDAPVKFKCFVSDVHFLLRGRVRVVCNQIINFATFTSSTAAATHKELTSKGPMLGRYNRS